MKNLFLTFLLLVITSSVAYAQLGIGGVIGSKAGIDDDFSEKMGFGINPRLKLNVTETTSITPGGVFFFSGSPDEDIYDDVSVTYWQVFADIHYQLEPSFYGIFGLNYSYGSAETEVLDVSIAVEDYEIGANFGVGIISLPFFSEIKYDTSFDQVSLSVGIYFTGD